MTWHVGLLMAVTWQGSCRHVAAGMVAGMGGDMACGLPTSFDEGRHLGRHSGGWGHWVWELTWVCNLLCSDGDVAGGIFSRGLWMELEWVASC